MTTKTKRDDMIHFPLAANVRPKVAQLCRMLEAETGVPRIYPYHAITVALDEAIARRGVVETQTHLAKS